MRRGKHDDRVGSIAKNPLPGYAQLGIASREMPVIQAVDFLELEYPVPLKCTGTGLEEEQAFSTPRHGELHLGTLALGLNQRQRLVSAPG